MKHVEGQEVARSQEIQNRREALDAAVADGRETEATREVPVHEVLEEAPR